MNENQRKKERKKERKSCLGRYKRRQEKGRNV